MRTAGDKLTRASFGIPIRLIRVSLVEGLYVDHETEWEAVINWPRETPESRRPREYRSQKMPGQKTDRWLIRPNYLIGIDSLDTARLVRLDRFFAEKNIKVYSACFPPCVPYASKQHHRCRGFRFLQPLRWRRRSRRSRLNCPRHSNDRRCPVDRQGFGGWGSKFNFKP